MRLPVQAHTPVTPLFRLTLKHQLWLLTGQDSIPLALQWEQLQGEQ